MDDVAGLRYRSTSNGTPVDTGRAVARRITPGRIFDEKSEQDANRGVPVATGQQQSPTGSVRRQPPHLLPTEDENPKTGIIENRYFGLEFFPQGLALGLSAQHRRHDDSRHHVPTIGSLFYSGHGVTDFIE
ncbi:MAG: hypothetical protein OXU19_01155 [bacterium]|nr:hypothetical protein [bacterium]MDE0418423.1 hypothetical protein [bacterium]